MQIVTLGKNKEPEESCLVQEHNKKNGLNILPLISWGNKLTRKRFVYQNYLKMQANEHS